MFHKHNEMFSIKLLIKTV